MVDLLVREPAVVLQDVVVLGTCDGSELFHDGLEERGRCQPRIRLLSSKRKVESSGQATMRRRGGKGKGQGSCLALGQELALHIPVFPLDSHREYRSV